MPSNYWKYRNLNIIKYGADTGVIQAGPVEERQALSDWNRLANAGEKCTYFINGQRLSDMRPNGFSNIEELHDFFKQHLFPDADAKHVDELATLAIKHFHQAGLPHATNFSVKNISTNNQNVKVSDPESRINFIPSKDGLVITEKNTYKKWQDTSHGKPIAHECSASKPFYAETETRYRLTPEASIELTELVVNCPSQYLAPIFDKRPKNEQTMRVSGGEWLKNIVAELIQHLWGKPEFDATPPEPRNLFTP